MAAAAPIGTIAKTATGATNVSTLAINTPASIVAGEGIIVGVSFDQNGSITVNAGSTSGWVKLGQQANGVTTTLAVFWQPNALGGGSDTLIVDIATAERGTALARRIEDFDPAITPDIAFADGTAAANACNPPNVAVTGGPKDTLYLAIAGIDQGAGAAPTAAPTNYTTDFDGQAGPSQGSHIGWGFRTINGSSSDDPGNFTHASGAWVGATVAFHPVAAGAHTTDSDTVVVTITPSGAENRESADTGTALVKLTPSSTDVQEGVDSATALVTITPSGVDTYTPPPSSVPFPSLPLLDDFNIADGAPSADWNNVNGVAQIVSNTLAALDEPPTAWAILYEGSGAPTGPDQACSVVIVDALPATPGSQAQDSARGVIIRAVNLAIADEGYQVVIQRGDGGANTTDAFACIWLADHSAAYTLLAGPEPVPEPIPGTSVIGAMTIGTEISLYYADDGNIVGTSAIISAIDSYYPDPDYMFGPSAWEVNVGDPMFDDFSGGDVVLGDYSDSGTVTLTLTPSSTEARESTDTGTARVSITPSSTEARESTDANTALVALTPSGSDIHTSGYEDTGTATVTLTPSGVDVTEYVDSATALLTLTPSAVETSQYVDAQVAIVTFTPSGTDTYQSGYVDAATVPITLSPSSTDVAAYVESATALVTLTPSGSDIHTTSASVDAATVYLRITPFTLSEIWYPFDTLLTANMSRTWAATIAVQRWSGSVTSHWGATMAIRRFSASLENNRWSAAISRKWAGLLGRS